MKADGTLDKNTHIVTCPPESCSILDKDYITCNTILNENGSVYQTDQCKCNESTNKWECNSTSCSGFPNAKCSGINLTQIEKKNSNDINFTATKCITDSGLQYNSPLKQCGKHGVKDNFSACTATPNDLQRCLDKKGQYYWDNQKGYLYCDLSNGEGYYINTSRDLPISP